MRQPIVMGDSGTYTRSRELFEAYSGVRQVRLEAHLSHAVLGRLDGAFGRTVDAPARALDTLMHAVTAWFVLSALAIGTIEKWSPHVIRYLGLVLLAPAALMYFGYRELGHLSLNAAAFPLVIRGLQHGSRRVDAGSALFGFGAALHGFGLLSLAGTCLAAFGAPGALGDRLRLAVRVVVWGGMAYLVWIVGYVLLQLPIVAGHTEAIPWRPWLVDEVGERLNVAILSARGGRDLFFTAWAAGAFLIAVAASIWRRWPEESRIVLLYALPSIGFIIVFWPIQGLALEMDLVFAAFPAVYALAWVCAHEARRTAVAAAVLASGHIAFWRIVLDSAFVNSRL
jgi:hypothetical protein